MEPATKLDQPTTSYSLLSAASQVRHPERTFDESGREIQPWEMTAGKIIFYLTVAVALWFFYWLNGIQCPC